MKNYYDKYYQFMFFKINDFVKFRFYRKNELFEILIKLK